MPRGSRSSRSPSRSTPRPVWGGSRSTCCCPSPSSSGRSRASASATSLPHPSAGAFWVGGIVPLGYELRERKLLVREDEVQTIRLIFERYLAFLRSPTRKRVFIGRDGGAKPRQRLSLARQRRQSAGVLPSKILKTREFSALR